MLFGPAYKGIPLSVTTAIALSDEFDTDVRYCSNRKEVKDHGDVGILLGGPINDGDRVMMIEDVTTSGKSINETMPIIQAQGNVTVTGLCVSVDRMERGTGEKSAIAELEEKFGIRIHTRARSLLMIPLKQQLMSIISSMVQNKNQAKIEERFG